MDVEERNGKDSTLELQRLVQIFNNPIKCNAHHYSQGAQKISFLLSEACLFVCLFVYFTFFLLVSPSVETFCTILAQTYIWLPWHRGRLKFRCQERQQKKWLVFLPCPRCFARKLTSQWIVMLSWRARWKVVLVQCSFFFFLLSSSLCNSSSVSPMLLYNLHVSL